MLKSLQGLRVLAMVGIFAFHSGLLIKGTFPVTFFSFYQGLFCITHIVKDLNILHLEKIQNGLLIG